MRVLVTRPRPDGDATAAALAARGHRPLVVPLLEVSIERGAPVELAGVQAVLITSANGARALAANTGRRDLRLFAVGDASAATARDLGFPDVVSAAGKVDDLAALVGARLSPAGGPLLHVAGSVTAGDLSGRLAAAGFAVSRVVLYRADPVTSLPAEAAGALRSGTIEAALFYSPRTAEQFSELAAAAGLAAACAGVIAIALSRPVADRLSALPFAEIRIAETPDQASLFRTLEGIHT